MYANWLWYITHGNILKPPQCDKRLHLVTTHRRQNWMGGGGGGQVPPTFQIKYSEYH